MIVHVGPQGKDCRVEPFVSRRGGCYYYPDTELVARPNHDLSDRMLHNEARVYVGFRIVKTEPSESNPHVH